MSGGKSCARTPTATATVSLPSLPLVLPITVSAWQTISDRQPKGTAVLVLPSPTSPLRSVYATVARVLREKGKSVKLYSAVVVDVEVERLVSIFTDAVETNLGVGHDRFLLHVGLVLDDPVCVRLVENLFQDDACLGRDHGQHTPPYDMRHRRA